MMDHRAITGNAITAVITAAVMGVIVWVAGIFNAGNNAMDVSQIKAVIEEVHMRDNGITYGASLASIDQSLVALSVGQIAIREDIDDLENAVGALASE